MTISKLLVDSDTGIDDAMGLVLTLLDPAVEVLGITTLSGNVPVDDSTANALRLVELLEKSTPVMPGAATSLLGSPMGGAAHVHGPRGHGAVDLPPPSRKAAKGPAAEFIAAQVEAHAGELTLVAVGPLTNLALAQRLHPGVFARHRPRIVWMGGAISRPGNISPCAEFNAASDPEAAAAVLASDPNLRIVPLDVTELAPDVPGAMNVTGEDLVRYREYGTPQARYLADICPQYIDFYERVFGSRACPMHSAVAMAIAADPTLVRSQERLHVAVETSGTHTRGMLVADRRHKRLLQTLWQEPSGGPRVVTAVDSARFKARFDERLRTFV